MKVNTVGREGRLKKSAKVYSNDPKKPETRISISTVVKQFISVKPKNRVRLLGYEGEEIKKQVTITSVEEQPLEIKEITSDIGDKIEYKLEKKGKDYTLEIKNRTTQEGSYRGRIKLKTNSEKKPLVVVYVTGRILGSISLEPKSLSFGVIDTNWGNFDTIKFEKIIRLRDLRGGGLIIEEIKPSRDWILIENKRSEGGRDYAIIVTLDNDKLPKGQFEERISIHTTYKKEPIVVNVKGEVI